MPATHALTTSRHPPRHAHAPLVVSGRSKSNKAGSADCVDGALRLRYRRGEARKKSSGRAPDLVTLLGRLRCLSPGGGGLWNKGLRRGDTIGSVFERFTERARQVVVLAQDEARALRHNYIGTEHILLGLLREEEGLAARVLDSLDIYVEEVRILVARIVGQGEEVTNGQIPFTPRAKKVLELALREALSLGHNYVGTEHVLLGLVRENDGVAARILLDFDVDAEKIRNAIIRMISGPNYVAPSTPPLFSPRPPGRNPMQWEYHVVSLTSSDANRRQEELTELGVQGWQLVTVTPGEDDLQWVFQRPLLAGHWIGSASVVGQGGRRSGTVDEETRARTMKELHALIAAAKARALTDNDSDRASLIDDLERRLNGLVDRIVKNIEGITGDVPDESPDASELVVRLEDGTLTVGEVLDFARRAKEAAIEARQFESAAERRDRQRKLVNLLAEIRRATLQPDPPPDRSAH